MNIVREETPTGVMVRLEGTLNLEAAEALAQTLADEVGEQKTVTVDFSHLREFLDSAVPTVLEAVKSHGCQLHGLMDHQVRLFHYFGHTAPQSLEQDARHPEERGSN